MQQEEATPHPGAGQQPPADGCWALIWPDEEYLHREQIVFSRNVNLFTVYVKISHQILVSLETCQQGSAFQFVNIHDLFVHNPANDTKIVDSNPQQTS